MIQCEKCENWTQQMHLCSTEEAPYIYQGCQKPNLAIIQILDNKRENIQCEIIKICMDKASQTEDEPKKVTVAKSTECKIPKVDKSTECEQKIEKVQTDTHTLIENTTQTDPSFIDKPENTDNHTQTENSITYDKAANTDNHTQTENSITHDKATITESLTPNYNENIPTIHLMETHISPLQREIGWKEEAAKKEVTTEERI